MQPAESLPLDIESLRHLRRDAAFGADIHYFDDIDSTNTHLRALARAGAAEGVVVIAERQSRGRGRLGRSWESPPFRNLYLSILLRPDIAPTDAPLIALVAGLATARCLATFGVDARIKWPNDVLIDGRKVAGILTEMETDEEGRTAVVLGIGINVNLQIEELPEVLRDKAGSLAVALGRTVARHDVADRLLSALEQDYDRFRMHGFEALRAGWNRLSCLTGRHVTIDDGARRVAGEVVGLGADGALELRGDDGAVMRVVAGDVNVVDGYGRG